MNALRNRRPASTNIIHPHFFPFRASSGSESNVPRHGRDDYTVALWVICPSSCTRVREFMGLSDYSKDRASTKAKARLRSLPDAPLCTRNACLFTLRIDLEIVRVIDASGMGGDVLR